jgi:hypothetical protein
VPILLGCLIVAIILFYSAYRSNCRSDEAYEQLKRDFVPTLRNRPYNGKFSPEIWGATWRQFMYLKDSSGVEHFKNSPRPDWIITGKDTKVTCLNLPRDGSIWK